MGLSPLSVAKVSASGSASKVSHEKAGTRDEEASKFAGIPVNRTIIRTALISGGLAGMAGTVVLLGVTQQMTASFGTSVGFDSIAVALLGRSSPFGIVLAALLFGAMRAGAGAVPTISAARAAGVVSATATSPAIRPCRSTTTREASAITS